MTPAKARSIPLSDASCYHEIGHLYVALCKGVPCDLDLAMGIDTDAGAATFWGSLDTPQNRIVSMMAGAYAQLIYAEDSVPVSMRDAIRTGTLYDYLIRDGNYPREAGFFGTDILTIWNLLLVHCADQDQKLALVRESFRQLQALFVEPRREAVFEAIHSDIRAWMEMDDPNIEEGDRFLVYGRFKSKAIYDRFV
jgi:hypothetical protein